MRSLAVLVLVSTVALTLGDYVFKSAVARVDPARAARGVLRRLLRGAEPARAGRAGPPRRLALPHGRAVHRALWILPALLFVGAAGVALGGGLAAALLLKGADGSLRNSVHRTGTELLYVPLPDAIRTQSKPIIDLVGQRGGQALASLLILSETVLARGDVVLAGRRRRGLARLDRMGRAT